MIVKRSNYPLRGATYRSWRSIAAAIVFLLGITLSASAQPSDDTTRTSDTTVSVETDTTALVDTTGRFGGRVTELTPQDDVTERADDDGPFLYIGAYGGFSLIGYDAFLPPSVFNAALTTLPPASTFTSGDGQGAIAGLLIELPIGDNFNLGARIGYQLHSGELIQSYTNTTDVRYVGSPPDPQPRANVQGTVATKFGHVAFTPYARVAPFSFPLYFYGGPTVMLPAQAAFTYTERIGGPPNVAYLPTAIGVTRASSTSRSLGNRDFSNAGTAVAISAGVGYEEALSKEIGVFGELQFQPMLNDYLSPLRANEFWTGSSLTLLIGFRYGLYSSPTPPPPRVIARDTAVVRPTLRPDSTFAAVGVTPSGLNDTITVSRRRIKATEVHALLPYIFFERDSARIPERYVQIAPKDRSKFQIERLPRGSTLDIYYNLLNIVGQRIREDRVRQVTVTGCISQFEPDTTLALRRAEAVRDYLVTVWRVPAARIKVVAQGLPTAPSLSEVDTLEASRENQRVEISSDGFIVERPVALPDTTLLAPIGVVRFLPPPTQPDTTGLVDGWALDVRIGDSLIKRAVTGSGTPPKQIDFEIENRPDLDLRGPVEVSSTLTIRDTLYQDLYRISSRPVVVVPEGEYEEERTVVGGRYVDEYNLLLFNFDQDQAANFTLQASDIMKRKIDSSSVISIVGHTDRIGLPYYNQALSQRRAEFAAQLLGLTPDELRGAGEKGLLYDNQYPEGRYYSRTVTITVETPIPGQETAPRGRASSNRRRGSSGTLNGDGEGGEE